MLWAGARFAKWRAVLKIADGGPSAGAIESNAYGLAAYAKIAQVSSMHCVISAPLLTHMRVVA